MILFFNILSYTGYYLPEDTDIATGIGIGISSNLTKIILAVAGSAIELLATGGGVTYIIFRKQFRLKHQSEGEKLKHKANQEGINTKLREAEVRREIREMELNSLKVTSRRVSMLQNELVQANEKAYKAKAETYYYKHEISKLKAEVLYIKERLNTGFCAVKNCPNRKNETI